MEAYAGELIIVRGLPGSGKSSLASVLAEAGRYPVFSIDDYFTDENGYYRFVFEDNHKAYAFCAERAEKAMKRGIDKIFIDNVFSLDWELEPYLKLAIKYNYRAHVLTCEKYHNGRNIHGIDDLQVQRIAEKYKVKLS